MGIEPNSTSIGVLYNRTSKCVIAHFHRVVNEFVPVEEIYFRGADDLDYRKAVFGNDTLSFTDPVSCQSKPYVYFNAVRLKLESGEMNWYAVIQLALPGGRLSLALDSTTLQLPAEYDAGWVASILGIDDAGQDLKLVCRLGLERQTGPQTSVVDYWICDVNLRNGAIYQLARLPRVFA